MTMRQTLLAVIGSLVVLSLGCTASKPTPTPSLTRTPLSILTPTPTSTATPTLTPTPTPSPTPTPEQVRALLRQLAPGFQDLPTGYQLVEAGKFISNEEAARDSIAEHEVLKAYDRHRRLLGYAIGYERAGTALSATVDLFATAEGARQAFNWLPPGFADQRSYFEAELRYTLTKELGAAIAQGLTVSFTQLSMAPIGNQLLAGRVTLALPGTFVTVALSMACMVERQVIACVAGFNPSSSSGSEAEVELLTTLESILRKTASKTQTIPGL